jgi:hypothetical protein
MRGILDKIMKYYTDVYYLGCPGSIKESRKTRINHSMMGWTNYSTLRDVEYRPNSLNLDNL